MGAWPDFGWTRQAGYGLLILSLGCVAELAASTPSSAAKTQVIAQVASAASGDAEQSAIATCDQLAASPYDDSRPLGIAGVKYPILKPDEAMSACAKAVDAEPQNARLMYQYGRALQAKGGNASLQSAVKWYDKAARLGHVGAQWNLGATYLAGMGVKRDVNTGLQWMERAAEDGFTYGQYLLGTIYSNGHAGGTYLAVDPDKEFYWISKAAQRGNIAAQVWLGWMYVRGRAVAVDRAKAVEWFERAAKQGAPDARHALDYIRNYH